MKPSLFALITLLGVQVLSAATVEVSALPALASAIAKASPGDRIILVNGTYSGREAISIACRGTEKQPIVIEARTLGQAEIQGEAGFTLDGSAAYVVIQGFRFAHTRTMRIQAGAHHCRVLRNLFELAPSPKAAYLEVCGDDNEIGFNTFQNKRTEGQMISVQGPGSSGMAQRTWIHHNYFTHFKPVANNCSAIQVGLSSRSLTPAHALVEHNLFIETAGENEGCICNKSCDNVYRFNTFGEGSRELSLRHGNRCEVYGNFFIGTEGLRFYGRDHKIYNNYFERCRPAISIGNGDGIIPPADLKMHDRPDGVRVIFNTLLNNQVNVIMAGRRTGLGATNLVFANNLIQGGGKAVMLSGPTPNARWEGNLVWTGQSGPGDLPAAGFTSADPQLQLQLPSASPYHLRAGSPAIGKAVGSYPEVTTDINGRARGQAKDIGADQISVGPILNRILTPADVGPDALELPVVRPSKATR